MQMATPRAELLPLRPHWKPTLGRPSARSRLHCLLVSYSHQLLTGTGALPPAPCAPPGTVAF